MRRHWPQKCQDLLWFAYHYTLKSILLTNFQALLVSYAKFNNFYLLLIQMIESGPKNTDSSPSSKVFLVL